MGLTLGPVAVLLLSAIALIYVGSVIWVYRDAETQGKRGWVMAALVALFFWPISLIVWVFSRPRPSA